MNIQENLPQYAVLQHLIVILLSIAMAWTMNALKMNSCLPLHFAEMLKEIVILHHIVMESTLLALITHICQALIFVVRQLDCVIKKSIVLVTVLIVPKMTCWLKVQFAEMLLICVILLRCAMVFPKPAQQTSLLP